jgi:hypothetical membrane protein
VKFKVDTVNQKLKRFGGFCGIVGSVLPIIMVFAATIISPWFRWDTNALSELGLGEVASLFNIAMLVGGVFSFFFALGIREYLTGERLAKVGSIFIILGSMCLTLVGVFTISDHILHGIVSFGFFVLPPIGFILIGFGTEEIVIRKISLASGFAALLAILLLPMIILVLPFRVGFAVPEMAESIIIASWMIFMGVKLLKH